MDLGYFNFVTLSPLIKIIEPIINKINDPVLINLCWNIKWTSDTKFVFLKEQLESPFLKDSTSIIELFMQLQKISFAINKLIHCFRFKKAKQYNTEDLFMNPIQEGQKGIITIYENKTKYLFQIRELINSIQFNLSNCCHFFPDPKPCKNPYTNMPFHKSNLYNIYFAIKYSAYSMPPLLEKFFLESFDLYQFTKTHQFLINEEYLEQYTHTNLHINNIIYLLNSMFIEHRFNVYIHKKFPRYRLIEIMRPYIDLYNKSKYYMNGVKAQKARQLLSRKLHILFEFNPTFGRKKLSIKYKCQFQHCTINDQVVLFDDKHPPFNELSTTPFITSHLSNDIIEESEEEVEEEDNESSEDTEIQESSDSYESLS